MTSKQPPTKNDIELDRYEFTDSDEFREMISEANTNEVFNNIHSNEFHPEWEINFETSNNKSDQPFSAEVLNKLDELVKDWSNATRQNQYYAGKLGWQHFYDQINDLLLPFSGQQNVSLDEEAFAEAAAAWQHSQGLTADGIIGPNTWNRMKSILNHSAGQPQPIAASPAKTLPPSGQNIFYYNKWYAEKILDTINTGVVTVNPRYNPKPQLEAIIQGFPVKSIDPKTKTLQILPIMYYITQSAFVNNYRDIMLGSFIRDPFNGKCTGHCVGRCIDINYKFGSFNTPGSVQMVINILTYLTSLPARFKKNLGFGLPVQGNFFAPGGNALIDIIDHQIKQLIPQLGIVFKDNPDHLHIQVKWL